MSGRDYVNPHQLKMFMSAKEIEAGYVPLESDRETTMRGPETDDQLWNRKYREAGYEGLGREVMEQGVQDPVTLSTDEREYPDQKPQLLGGHHRISVLRRNKPDELMPVLHYRDFEDLVETSYKHDNPPYRYT